jgi:hypothetical protein
MEWNFILTEANTNEKKKKWSNFLFPGVCVAYFYWKPLKTTLENDFRSDIKKNKKTWFHAHCGNDGIVA